MAASVAVDNISDWAGGTATLAALGTSSGGALALAAADAWLLSEAFERGAMLLDNRKIYHQTDRDGVDWKYNGTHWTEQRLGDLHQDGQDRPQPQSFFALPEKARELNYLASNEAVAQAMGNVHPRNPYVQPADDSDRAHLFQRDWVHDAGTGTWSRSVADEVNRNDQPLWNVEAASSERTASLNQQALQVIDANIGTGTADLAARYQRVYHRNGWEDFGPMPQVVQTALDPDNLQAANGKQYHRNEQGQWWHDGERAQGNAALELETTRQRLQPVLEQHAQAMAATPPRQAPIPEQQDRDNIAATYRAYGLTPVAHGPAIQLAVERTRQAHGLESGNTSLALEPDAFGQYSVNSPIRHLRQNSDALLRLAGVSSNCY